MENGSPQVPCEYLRCVVALMGTSESATGWPANRQDQDVSNPERTMLRMFRWKMYCLGACPPGKSVDLSTLFSLTLILNKKPPGESRKFVGCEFLREHGNPQSLRNPAWR